MDFLPLPLFSIDNVAIWFAQLEAAFSLNGILSDADKYNYVLTQIPPKFTTIMEDVILSPPREDDQYASFKYEFIKRMSVYKMKQENMGSKKPSEYLHTLKNMADKRVPLEYILNVWLNNLPLKVREIVGLETTGHPDILCEMADKVMALVKPEPRGPEDKFQSILGRVDEIAKQVRKIQLMYDGDYCETVSGPQYSVATQGGSNISATNSNVIKYLPNKIVYFYNRQP